MLTQKFHFLNACRVYSGRFSCAVDCFLEIWIHTVSGFYSDSHFSSYVLGLLQYISSQFRIYESRGADALLLHKLREGFWEYLRSRCESFAVMNCDAQFSEIFQHNVFSDFSIQEPKVIFSKYSSGTFCSNCQINVEASSEVLINYVSLSDLLHLNFLPENGPEYISRSNSCSTVQCHNCDNFGPTVSFAMELSTVLFVEFNEAMQSVALFQSDIVVECSYQLVAMVRHIGSHFTCAIK